MDKEMLLQNVDWGKIKIWRQGDPPPPDIINILKRGDMVKLYNAQLKLTINQLESELEYFKAQQEIIAGYM